MPTLIIPQYNHSALTLRCLNSLHQHEFANFQTLIIDDGSHPRELRQLQQRHYPRTEIIQQPHAGTTTAWNRAIRHASTPLLIFLNNDTITRGPWIDQLVAPLRNQQARMTGTHWREERHLTNNIREQLPTTRFLTGWCFAIELERLLQLGGFNPRLRLYFSDTDLQCRLLAHPRAYDNHPPQAADPRQIVPDLPLHHEAHQTTHASPKHRIDWHKDRNHFTRIWTHP